MLDRLFPRLRRRRAAATLYVALVDHARLPGYYSGLGVPDTPLGRFDMIALLVFLALRRLQADGLRHRAFCQALFDYMFTDMDRNLREMGVGDLSVGKKVKDLAQAFYGRSDAYERGLRAADDAELMAALRRNLYADAAVAEATLSAMAQQTRALAAALDAQPSDVLLAGAPVLPPPPAPLPEVTP